MIYGIELKGRMGWDLFCSKKCADHIHKGETPDSFTCLDQFDREHGFRSGPTQCFHCQKKLPKVVLIGAPEKFKIIEVTQKVRYLVPMQNETISEINGWTLDEIKSDWFKNPNSFHATRDSHKIGNAVDVSSIEVKDDL